MSVVEPTLRDGPGRRLPGAWTSPRATATATRSRRIARRSDAVGGRGGARRRWRWRRGGRVDRRGRGDGRRGDEAQRAARTSATSWSTAAGRRSSAPSRRAADRRRRAAPRRAAAPAARSTCGRSRSSRPRSPPLVAGGAACGRRRAVRAGAALGVLGAGRREPARGRARPLVGDAARARRSPCRGWISATGIPPDIAHAGRGADDADRRAATSTTCSRRWRCASSPTATRNLRFAPAHRLPRCRGRGDALPRRRSALRATARGARHRGAERASTGRDRAAMRDGGRFFLFHRAAPLERAAKASGWARSASAASSSELNAAAARRRRVGALRRASSATPRALRGVRYVITLDTDTQLPRDAARAARRHDGASAQPPALRRRGVGRGRARATASCSRAWASACRAPAGRASPACSPASRHRPVHARGLRRLPGRCSAKARSSARASTTSTPSSARSAGASRRTASSATTCSKAATRAPGCVSDVSCSRTTRRRYAADVSRRHRWIRGDWQIAAWLLPRVPGAGGGAGAQSALGAVALEDLRQPAPQPRRRRRCWRCCWPAGSCRAGAAVVDAASLLAILLLPALLAAQPDAGARKPARCACRPACRSSARPPAARSSLRELFATAPACRTRRCVACDAIVRTLSRMLVMSRRLLEWRPSSDVAARAAAATSRASTRRMWIAPVGSRWRRSRWRWPPARGAARRPRRCWCSGSLSPALAWWLSRAAAAPRPRPERGADASSCARLARRTWRVLRDVRRRRATTTCRPTTCRKIRSDGVAHRTSPTNIGLALLANLAALRFRLHHRRRAPGAHRSARWRRCETLERYRGHFYNWYDTQHARAAAAALRLLGRQRQSRRPLLTLRAGLLLRWRRSRRWTRRPPRPPRAGDPPGRARCRGSPRDSRRRRTPGPRR